MADGGGGAGGAPPLGAGDDWLRLSSFDATTFFAQQQQQQDEQRSLQGQQLQAAADMLLPSSSDEGSDGSGSSSGDDSGGGKARPPAGSRKTAGLPPGGRRSRSPGGGSSGSERARRRDKKRRRGRSADADKGGRSKKRRREKDGREGKRQGKDKDRDKERRRQRESERDQQVRLERQTGAAQRASQVKAWAGAGAAGPAQEPYYFDTRGDPANLAFGALYRMDVARYNRFDPAGFAASLGARRRGALYGVRQLATEADGHAQRDRTNRYFGPNMQRAERSGRLKRWRRSLQPRRPGAGDAMLLGWRRPPAAAMQQAQQGQHRMSLPSPGFLPLKLEGAEDGAHLAGQRQPGQGQRPAVLSAAAELAEDQEARRQREGETNEEVLLRRTREYNVATRERPHDLQLWLEFAGFQDEALRLGPARRGGDRAVAEKKISILEKALSLHPGSDELLLALLGAAEAVCEDAELERRWRAVLARHPGSPRLWRAYLQHRQARFGGFCAADVASAYDEAFAALRREHARRVTQGAPSHVLAELECEAAALALGGVAQRLAAGATERGVAAALVLLEYNLFAPEGWPEDALEAMFEEFWGSGAPLVGEPGGAGWASWLAGEPPAAALAAAEGGRQRRKRERVADEEDERLQREARQAQQAQQAEWSGWEELAPAIRARFGHSLRLGGEDAAAGDLARPDGSPAQAEQGAVGAASMQGVEEEEAEEAAAEEEAEEWEETEEQLLERLGLHLEAALEEASEAPLTPELLEAWLATERQRQAAQWAPRRAEAAGAADAGEAGEQEDEEAVARRTVAWRDVRRLLWRFESASAQQQLLAGCLQLLGAPLPGALPSNGPAAAAAGGSQGDELWQAAAAAGCYPVSSAGASQQQCSAAAAAGEWAGELLAQGDWGWLIRAGGAPAQPHTLRQQPWYRAEPSRQALLQRLLAALVRGPCRHDGAVAAALLAVAADECSGACSSGEADAGGQAAVAGGAAGAGAALDRARTLAKQLLAEQRTNLVLWQAYAQLELSAGNTKAARKVYQTCFATTGAPAGLAAAAAAAPLVLGAAQLHLQLDGSRGGGATVPALLGALPSPADAAPGRSSGGRGLPLSLLVAAPAAALAAAAKQLAWLGSGGAVALPTAGAGSKGGGGAASAAAAAASPLSQEEVVSAKRGFQDHLLALTQHAQRAQQQLADQGAAQQAIGGGLTAADRALVAAAASFEQLVGLQRGSLAAGVRAALAIYEQVLTALAPQPAPEQAAQAAGPRDAQLELLSWQRCQLAAEAARHAVPCAPPAAARDALLRALRLFPGSAALLQLLVAHEMAGHTLTQLRRELHALLELRPLPQVWLSMVAVEVATRSPGAVVAGTLERAVSHPSGRACPLLWRCYLRFEAHRGRHEAVRRLFLRAIGACPGSKAVWCDGLALLNGHVAPKELSEYLEVMKDKGVVLRADVFEVALEQLGAAGQLGAAPD